MPNRESLSHLDAHRDTRKAEYRTTAKPKPISVPTDGANKCREIVAARPARDQ